MTTIRSIHDDYDRDDALPSIIENTVDHVWDSNGVCQIHGGYCSMCTTEPDGVVSVLEQEYLDRLEEIAARLRPCPPPDVMNGYDLCPCGTGPSWPCAVTEAAWLARGLDPHIEAHRILNVIVDDHLNGRMPGDAA